MPIPDHAKANFATLLRAAEDGNLALMECTEVATGAPRYVICAVGRDGGDYVFTPFGHLAPGDLYEACRPPEPSGEDASFAPP
jgi:Family of unknown function (DUF6117)